MPAHHTNISRDALSSKADVEAPKHGALGHLSADEELQQAVCSALIEHAELDTTRIGVRVASETVILSGSVDSPEALQLAVKLASEYPGVASVQADELRIGSH